MKIASRNGTDTVRGGSSIHARLPLSMGNTLIIFIHHKYGSSENNKYN